MSRLFYFLTVAVVACGTSSERPIVAPMTPAPAPIAPSEEPPGDVRIDGIHDGFGHGDVYLWSSDGTLLATASQSAVLHNPRT